MLAWPRCRARKNRVTGPRSLLHGRREAQRPVAVGVELGQLAVDADDVRAVEVHVLIVARPDVRESACRLSICSLIKLTHCADTGKSGTAVSQIRYSPISTGAFLY